MDNHPEFPTSQAITLSNGGSIQFRSGSSYVDTYNLVYSDLVAGDGELTVEIKGNSVGTGQLKLQTQTSEEEYYVFTNQKTEVYPDNLTVPNCTILELTEEEKNRLGHGIPYTMQGYMKLTSTESYIRNWGKNFKMGIFNNPISENITIIETVDPETGETTDEIIDSIEEISDFSDCSEYSDNSDISNPSTSFDLTGRRVSDVKPNTIYIRKGKKYIIK